MLDKWKAFGVEETLSEWKAGVSAVELFDLIADANYDDLETIFGDNEVVVWEPFECWTVHDVATQLQDIAARAERRSQE